MGTDRVASPGPVFLWDERSVCRSSELILGFILQRVRQTA